MFLRECFVRKHKLFFRFLNISTYNTVLCDNKYTFSRVLHNETLCPSYQRYFHPQEKLITSSNVNRVIVWMKPLTGLLTLKTNLQGYFLDIPISLTVLSLCLIVGRILWWWASWWPRPKSRRGFDQSESWIWIRAYLGRNFSSINDPRS